MAAPHADGLNLEAIGLTTDRGRIPVDSHFRTSVPNVYAIGDVVPGPMLAHKAEEDGVAAAEIMAGRAGHVNYATVPNIVYTHPEIASVGMTEAEAKDSGVDTAVGKFSFMANSRARCAPVGVSDVGACGLVLPLVHSVMHGSCLVCSRRAFAGYSFI